MNTHPPTKSPAGDQRERAVPCQFCRRPTFNIEALCHAHLELRPALIGRLVAS